MNNTVCAFTAVCQEDLVWLHKYLCEVERLNLPFGMHLDRCLPHTWAFVQAHPLCLTTTISVSDAEFNEQHKQPILDSITALGYGWAFAWDIDETYETGFRNKLDRLLPQLSGADCVDLRWLNLWDDERHVRTDRNFDAGHRVKLYNLNEGRRWAFDHPITNGAKLVGREGVTVKVDLVCLHHGMMTPELRRQHKARWDRIYSTALRGDPNPYGFWREAIATEDSAVTVKHGYF